MEKLITHVKAAEVEDSYTATALSWPLWESCCHPQVALLFPLLQSLSSLPHTPLHLPHQTPAKSGKFHFDYNGDYETERVLIMSGKANLSPDDGSAKITIATGDQVFFHKGFACNWHVTEPMTKHYAYFGADGEEVVSNNSITCDICQAECSEESYLTVDEEDICPDCYKVDKKMYAKAEHQKFGEAVKPAKGTGKREATESNGTSKKKKNNDT